MNMASAASWRCQINKGRLTKIMRLSLLRSLVALFALFTACKRSPAPNPSIAEPSSSTDALEVSIAIPLRSDNERAPHYERVLDYSHLQFPVVITNRSDSPQRIFEDWNSWGYYALSFEVTEAGATWNIKKGFNIWMKNFPSTWTLLPHEHLVIEVNLSDKDVWEPFPVIKDFTTSITMRAIFQIPADESSKKLSVWTGRVLSKAEKYKLYDPR